MCMAQTWTSVHLVLVLRRVLICASTHSAVSSVRVLLASPSTVPDTAVSVSHIHGCNLANFATKLAAMASGNVP